MSQPSPAHVRRRNRRYLTLTLLVLILAGAWVAFWSYAQTKALDAVEGWKAREAKAGRVYDCGTQTIGGFPFRFELTCNQARAVLKGVNPPFELKSPQILVVAQAYQPTLLISEFSGPLTYAELGHSPSYVANWKLAQSSVRGAPQNPERVSIVLDAPNVRRVEPAAAVLDAARIEIHARMLEGSARNKPVIEVVLRTKALSAPAAGPMAARPIDGEIDLVLRGLNDFSPKPWPQRFREIAQTNGRVEIRHARLQQGETLAVGGGTLTINPEGRLDGQINVTVAGAEAFINEVAAANRHKLGFSVSLGLGLLGGNKKLEGRPAMVLPLRIANGTMYVGPLKVGEVPALF